MGNTQNATTETVTLTCDSCGQITETLTEVEGGGHVCDECLAEHYEQCVGCGEYIEYGNIYDTPRGLMCETCRDEAYVNCGICGNAVERDGAYVAYGEDYDEITLCGHCYDCHTVRCDRCGDTILTSCTSETWDGERVCDSCRNNHYVRCDGCNREVFEDDTIDFDGEVLCPDCAEERERGGANGRGDYTSETFAPPTKILNYHCNTCRVFLKTPEDAEHGARYYGVELETDSYSCDDVAEAAAGALGILNKNSEGSPRNNWTAMHDGSLNCGFELISQPMTANYFEKNDIEGRLREAMKSLIRSGMRSHNNGTCGLHFHVSRDSLSEDCIANMMILVDRFYESIIIPLSRRNMTTIVRWANKEDVVSRCRSRKDYDYFKAYTKHDNYEGGRYHAINLTNRNTVELRIFRGTLKLASFMAAFHFFRFLIEWSETHTYFKALKVKQEAFLADMAAYSPELKNYMTERGLCGTAATEEEESVA